MQPDQPVVRFLSVVPQFTVSDVARAARHYRDVLGFEIVGFWDGNRSSLETDPPPVFGIVRRDEAHVYFNRAGQSQGHAGRAQGAYDAYFHIKGIDELTKELRERGARILDGPEDRIYKRREVVVEDCNGFILAFAEDVDGHTT